MMIRPALLLGPVLTLSALMAVADARAQGFDLWADSSAAPKPVATPSPKAKPIHRPAPVIEASMAPVPAASAPAVTPPPAATPSYDPIVVPDDPKPEAKPVEAVGEDIWRPLALAASVVAGLLALALVIRLVQRGKAALDDWQDEQEEERPARRKPKPAAPAAPKPATLPSAAPPEVALSETLAPTPLLAAEPETEAPATPAPVPVSAFKPSPLFADLAEEEPTPDEPEPVPEPEPEPTPPALGPDALALSCAPLRFTTTLTQACLRYRLTLESHADEPLGPLTITATLVSPDNAQAGEEDIHRLILIHAGGSASVGGEVRLPLAVVAPVILADMRLFVPVLRVRVEARRVGELAEAPPLDFTTDFLVGAAQGVDGLAPFRLDDGPVIAEALAAHRVG